MVEPVFANICVRKHMNRFTLRTKHKVDTSYYTFPPLQVPTSDYGATHSRQFQKTAS